MTRQPRVARAVAPAVAPAVALGAIASLIAAVFAPAIAPAVTQAQAPSVRVAYGESCAQCQVVITKVTTVGSASDPVRLSNRVPIMVRDKRGRYFGVSNGESQVVVFDVTGSYVSSLGKAGQGPGEFGGGITSLFLDPRDTLFVLDASGNVSVFNPALRFVRRVRVPAVSLVAGVALSDGTLLWSGAIDAAEQFGWPFHIIGSDGKVVRSFGERSASSGRNNRFARTSRPFAMAPDGTSFWQVSEAAGQYDLQRRGVDGKVIESFTITDVPWIAPSESRGRPTGRGNARGSPVRPPDAASAVSLLGVDAAGRVWLVGVVRARGGDPPRVERTLVEVFDPKAKKLMVSRPLDVPGLQSLPNSNLSQTIGFDKDGAVTHVIWQVGVRTP
jgi:hypothetical protein